MQQNPSPKQTGERGKRIDIVHFSKLGHTKADNPDVIVLTGDVVFRHDSTYMYCDSAYMYESVNSLEAFGKVVIEQGDTLFIYGDYLYYDGNKSLAQLRENVLMENRGLELYTDNFDYDRIADIGYFFDGGMLLDSLNELTSVYGQYSPNTKLAHFYNIVELTNPNFTLKSDTLIYNTTTKVASILSPTVIEGDSGIIYSSKGWYDTIEDKAILLNRSVIVSNDKSKTITADSLAYSRSTGIGEAFGNMEVNDTIRKVILTGDYGYYDELTDFTFATDGAQFIEYSQMDSLFLHADTLQMKTIETEREVKAYHNVRFYRSDLQGVCDSMQYNTIDSLLSLYYYPVVWNDNYQITGDTIRVYFNQDHIEQVKVLDRAFATEHVDTAYYNQMRGRNIYAYFTEGELTKIDIEGDTESIYYPLEEGKGYVGQNTTKSSFMTIDVVNRKPVRIYWYPQSEGNMIPIPDITPENNRLKGFIDYDYLRPKNREDIFIKIERKETDLMAPRRKKKLILFTATRMQ